MFSLGLVDETNPRISGLTNVAEVFIHIRELCLLELADLHDGRYYRKGDYIYQILPNDFSIANPKWAEQKMFFITVIFFRKDEISGDETPIWALVFVVMLESEV